MSEKAYYCPECGRRYLLDLVVPEQTVRVVCGSCEVLFDPEQATAHPIPEGGLSGASSVMVAHESPSVCASVGRVLRSSGYVPRYVHTGTAALAAFDRALLDLPVALVLDVGVPEMLAFDVMASLRRREDLRALPIVLLASVFDPTRYKRRPSTLHGANTYLELHHVPDRLPEILREHLGDGLARGYRGHLPGEYAVSEAIRQGAEVDGDDRARIDARRIVSDIALYHEQEILQGLAEDDLEQRLQDAFEEGRQLFLKATRELGPLRGDPYQQAVKDLVASIRRRSEM
ncbi:MAG: hypothetical protein ABIJ09_19925 [Pseudomonadota bacterium]